MITCGYSFLEDYVSVVKVQVFSVNSLDINSTKSAFLSYKSLRSSENELLAPDASPIQVLSEGNKFF